MPCARPGPCCQVGWPVRWANPVKGLRIAETWFALNVVVPIELASELVGHASIDTTSIYSMQELARKIRVARG